MAANNYHKYDDDFKKSLVSLHQNDKAQTQLCKEYGVSASALGKWIKQYSTVQVDDGEVLTAKQVKELQKRNAQLEEENLILKSDCHLHATLKQRLDAVHKLRFQHNIKTLCRVLQVNRSTFIRNLHRASWKTSTLHLLSSIFMRIMTNALVLIKSLTFYSVIMAFTSVSAECTA